MAKLKLSIILGFTGIFTACMSTEHKEIPAVPPPAPVVQEATLPVGCGSLLSYYEAMLDMTVEDREQELNILRESQLKAIGDCDQLQLALLLSAPDTGFQNDREAALLLGDFLDNPKDIISVQDKQFARLLADHIQQRGQLRARQESLEKQLNDESAVSLKLRKNLTKLQSQLDQLKDIEKDINAKEESATNPDQQDFQ